MKKIIILLFALPLFISSCEKKLEIVPPFVQVEEVALSTVDGIDGGIRYAYNLQHSNFPVNHILWAELLSDELKYRPTTSLPNYQNYYDRNLRAVAEETVNATDLRGVNNIRTREIYNSINTASLILRAAQNDLAKNDVEYAANKNRIMGEAYFLRAAGNFQLLRFFSKAWGATADNSHPGIVINKEPVDDRISQVKARSTVAEVYDFVITDLIQAEPLMPDLYLPGVHPAGYNGRAYKDAVRALLARVYFQQQNYSKAKEVIDRLIGPTIVSTDPLVANNVTRHPLQPTCDLPFTARGPSSDYLNDENIWVDVAPLTSNGHSAAWYNANENLYRSWTPPTVLNVVGVNSVASNAFLTLANFEDTDQRKTLWFATLSSGELMPGKFSNSKFPQINLPLVRSAEMVLDRAEINARNNNVDDALNDLNVTRNRAGLASLTAPISQAALLVEIQTERLRELCFEGDRLWNLKRLQLDIPPGDRADQTVIPWDGLGTVLKYFLAEVDKNPLLENNY